MGLARERSCTKGFEAASKADRAAVWRAGGVTLAEYATLQKLAHSRSSNNPVWGSSKCHKASRSGLLASTRWDWVWAAQKAWPPMAAPSKVKAPDRSIVSPAGKLCGSTRPSWDVVMSLHLAGLSAKPTWRAGTSV